MRPITRRLIIECMGQAYGANLWRSLLILNADGMTNLGNLRQYSVAIDRHIEAIDLLAAALVQFDDEAGLAAVANYIEATTDLAEARAYIREAIPFSNN